MLLNYLNLEKNIRELMLEEVNFDIKNDLLYKSKRFSDAGIIEYSNLLKESIINGTDESLFNSLNTGGFFIQKETTKDGVVKNIPTTTISTFAEGQFNRFYMRAICLYAIKENIEIEFYRAKEVSQPRQESEAKIGQKVKPKELLDALRKAPGTIDENEGKLIPGPNSGLSIKIV